jgi:tRNA(Arg) A34 adenosine deaminase TadA
VMGGALTSTATIVRRVMGSVRWRRMSKQHELTAVIYDKKDNVLAIGKNSYVKTHPLQSKYARQAGVPERTFLHAEVAAIIKCKDLGKAHRIFVSRLHRDGTPALARPCRICQLAIKEAGIEYVDHT